MSNSKEVLLENTMYSSESETEKEGDWIQPSIIQQTVDLQSSGLIDGIYVQNSPSDYFGIDDTELAQEIEAWEAASNFDYWAFEESLKS
ncbi:MAG: hypothetical protein MAG431_00263 [Chloroflexi bacterium]|nr:hypothetical protein [Chloroflexota bacterium]